MLLSALVGWTLISNYATQASPLCSAIVPPRGTLVYCKAALISWLWKCLWTELTQPATLHLLLSLPLFLFWIHLEWGQEVKVLLEMTFSAMAKRHGYACMLCLGTACILAGHVAAPSRGVIMGCFSNGRLGKANHVTIWNKRESKTTILLVLSKKMAITVLE